VAGCCECGDEPSGSCATELVKKHVRITISLKSCTEIVDKAYGIHIKVTKGTTMFLLADG
jgi:hypothetical protein